MGLYNFQRQFVPYVLDGSKTHTIRAVRANADRPGDTLYLYSGLRQKGAQLLFRVPCSHVEDIRMCRARLWINGIELSPAEKDALAWRDGFREAHRSVVKGCFDRMLQFWAATHGPDEFNGHVVHWNYERRWGGLQ